MHVHVHVLVYVPLLAASVHSQLVTAGCTPIDSHYVFEHTGLRASVEDFAVNFWNWKEKAVLALLQKVLQGCHDNYQQSDDSLSPPPPTERAPGSPTPPPPSLPPPTMEAVAATATAEAHTWKLTAMILGLVLAAVLLLVAAVFLVVRATSNSGSAASSAAPEMEMM